MLINTDALFSMTQANQNFSQVARYADKNGKAVILKNNKPKYIILDIEQNESVLNLTDDEIVKIGLG